MSDPDANALGPPLQALPFPRDQTKTWDNPADAHADGIPTTRRWYRRQRHRWTCPKCGYHDYTAESAGVGRE